MAEQLALMQLEAVEEREVEEDGTTVLRRRYRWVYSASEEDQERQEEKT